MWVRARKVVTQWFAPQAPTEPPSPKPSPVETERARQAAAAARWAKQAAQARAEREAQEAAEWAARRRRSQEEIERACREVGWWFPGDVYSSRSRLRPSSWSGRLLGRLLGGGR